MAAWPCPVTRQYVCHVYLATVTTYFPPTCRGDTFKANEGVEAGGGPGEDPRPAEGHEAPRAQTLLQSGTENAEKDSSAERIQLRFWDGKVISPR